MGLLATGPFHSLPPPRHTSPGIISSATANAVRETAACYGLFCPCYQVIQSPTMIGSISHFTQCFRLSKIVHLAPRARRNRKSQKQHCLSCMPILFYTLT